MQVITPKLFSLLFQQPDLTQPISVLDFGCVCSQSIDFFNQFHCKLYIGDFASESLANAEDPDITDEQLLESYRSLMVFPEDARFDICLFWDFFSLLNNRGMQLFFQVLKPYLSDRAQGYGFGALSRRGELSYQNYRILDFDRLQAEEQQGSTPRLYAHGQSDFDSYLPPFKVTKGVLMQNGKLEVLLRLGSVSTRR